MPTMRWSGQTSRSSAILLPMQKKTMAYPENAIGTFPQIPGEGTERQYCVNRLLQSQPRCRVMPHIALSDDDNRRTNRGEHIRRDPAFNMALGEQSAAAQSARVTRRLAALGEMTGGIAHDFRNILSIIESGLRLAETRLDEPEKVRIDIAAA